MCVANNEWDMQARAKRRCALPGFPEALWGPPRPGPHMGRLRIWQPTAEEAAYANRPPEFSDDGCPGAWYRSTFVSSVAKYERLLTEGGFSGNVLLDRCDDRLVLEAVQFIEQERLRSRAFANERRRQKEA